MIKFDLNQQNVFVTSEQEELELNYLKKESNKYQRYIKVKNTPKKQDLKFPGR